MQWATHLKRVFQIDVETCSNCGGTVQITASTRDGLAQRAGANRAIFHQGNYRNADAFIGFMGMDVRGRQSGRWKGEEQVDQKWGPGGSQAAV